MIGRRTLTCLLSLVAFVRAAAPIINTPTGVDQCEPSQLSWSGGVAPYFVSIIPGGQPGATPLVSFAQTSATSMTWNVNIQAGTSITLQIKDSTGAINYSQAVTIGAGTSSACLTASTATATSVVTKAGAAGAAGETTTSAALIDTPPASAAETSTTTPPLGISSVITKSASSTSAPAPTSSTPSSANIIISSPFILIGTVIMTYLGLRA